MKCNYMYNVYAETFDQYIEHAASKPYIFGYFRLRKLLWYEKKLVRCFKDTHEKSKYLQFILNRVYTVIGSIDIYNKILYHLFLRVKKIP